jgi:FKBP-type peptidyl-prolyl cis-trans isomerase FkpA
MSKKSALARKREAQEAKRRRNRRLRAIGIGTAVVVIVAAIAVIVYFAVRDDNPTEKPQITELVVEDLVEGTGVEAQNGDLLSVYYTLWLYDDETQIQSNVGGTPFQFTLGAGGVIKGWDQGMVGMKEGGTRQLIIPPDLAYGASSQGDIPPNATLRFEVQLLAVG